MFLHSEVAAVLYGSVARGNALCNSDIDVLLVADAEQLPENIVRAVVSKTRLTIADVRRRISVVQYSWREASAMMEYGSLFFHHIRLEGQPLIVTDGVVRLYKMLDYLPRYQLVERDMQSFELAVDDVSASLADEGVLQYEMSVIATVLRHASILRSYLCGHPDFRRSEPILESMKSLGYDVLLSDLELLYDYRLFQSGRVESPGVLTQSETEYWLCVARAVVGSLREVAHE